MIRHMQEMLTRVTSWLRRKALDRDKQNERRGPSRFERGLDALHSIRRDVAHAARSLAKDRGFTLVCVISLGIGMGGLVALATFTRMISAPARGIDTNGLVELLVLPLGPLRTKAVESVIEEWSFPDYQALRDVDIGMAITGWARDFSQTGEQTPDEAAPPRVATLYVSANYFSTFGVSLARGPGFDPAIDDAPLAESRVIVSHDFWQRRMAVDPDIIGKSLTIDGVPHTVVGIAPVDFRGHFHFFQAPGSLLFGPEREAGFSIRRVRDNLQQASGVRSVALAEGMPIDFDYRLFRVAGTKEAEFVTAQVTRVGENFLETIGAPLLRGRTIAVEDRIMAAPVAVISKPLAEQLFPATEPIGERVTVTLEESREQEFTIVGVSADFATSQLTTERPQILLPLPEALAPTVHLIARGAPGDEPKLKAALENALRELGVDALPGVAFPGIVTGQDLVQKSLADLIAESTAVAFAGGVVLVLAALGIVGVVGFMVATRTRELAVRIALGATRLRVFGLVLSDIVKLVIPGVAGGLLLAAVLIRTMEDVMGTPLTLGPTPLGVMEPLIYALASTIAVSVALLAGLPAARRATSVQPMVAIRSE